MGPKKNGGLVGKATYQIAKSYAATSSLPLASESGRVDSTGKSIKALSDTNSTQQSAIEDYGIIDEDELMGETGHGGNNKSDVSDRNLKQMVGVLWFCRAGCPLCRKDDFWARVQSRTLN